METNKMTRYVKEVRCRLTGLLCNPYLCKRWKEFTSITCPYREERILFPIEPSLKDYPSLKVEIKISMKD